MNNTNVYDNNVRRQCVYIVTGEPYHDGSTILGVFSSLEKAEAVLPTLVLPGNVSPGQRIWVHGDDIQYYTTNIVAAAYD